MFFIQLLIYTTFAININNIEVVKDETSKYYLRLNDERIFSDVCHLEVDFPEYKIG